MSDDRAQEALLARELGVLVQDPPPPSGVDVAEAARIGRGRLRRRRMSVGGVALALAAAVTAGALALPTHDSAPGPASDNKHHALDPHDPLTAEADFGWLPPGLQRTVFSAVPGNVMPIALTATDDAETRQLLLFVHPKGSDPTKPGQAVDPTLQIQGKAPDVNGRQAFWLHYAHHDDTPVGLRWLLADNRWVDLILMAANQPAKGLPDALLRTARSVVFGERSVPLPFSVKSTPGLQVSQSGLTVEQRAGRPVLAYSTSEFLLRDKDGGGLSYFLTISPHTGAAPVVFPAIGTQARRGIDYEQTCTTAHGLDACLVLLQHLTPATTPPNLAALGGLDGLLSRITLLGPDSQNWTTDVIR